MNNNKLNIFATYFTHDIYMSPRSLNPSTPLLPNKRLQCVSHCWRRLLGRGTFPSRLPLWSLDRTLDIWTTRGKAHFLTRFKGQVSSQQCRTGELSTIKDWGPARSETFLCCFCKIIVLCRNY